MANVIYTIGHSTHSIADLIALLRMHNITAICDVRSKPYSRFNPQFNRDELSRASKERGITYAFLGRELGARSDDESCYEDGRVQYDRLAHTTLFRSGIKRVQEGSKEYRIALLCAEKEPLECHRAILVTRYLVALGLQVHHIHSDGKTESHEDAMIRLARLLNLREGEQHMFRSREDLFADAYYLQEKRIAYEYVQAEAEILRSDVG
jgi:uncharacterized protein (DUF488 family)